MDVHAAACCFDSVDWHSGKRMQLVVVRDFAIVPLLNISPIIGRPGMTLNCTGWIRRMCACDFSHLPRYLFHRNARRANLDLSLNTKKRYRDSIIRYLAYFGSLFIGSHFRVKHRSCNLWILRVKIKKKTQNIYFV